MEWRKWYLDAILVPLALVMMLCYHIYLSLMVRTQPFSTLLGINSRGRRIWIHAMIKVLYKSRFYSNPNYKTLKQYIMV